MVEKAYSAKSEFRYAVNSGRELPSNMNTELGAMNCPSLSNANFALSEISPHTIFGCEKSPLCLRHL